MSFDLKVFGNKLGRLRSQLQLDVEEVSVKTGIEPGRLKGLEEGNFLPTGDEVLIFADFYKQNYNYFISNQQKTASEQVDILYRKFGTEFSREDRLNIQEFIFLCECEEIVFKTVDFKKIKFDFLPTGIYYKAHGKNGAAELRDVLNLTDNQIIGNPYQTFRKLGIHIFRRKLKNSKISGLFINHPTAGKCVLVNYEEDIFRQNFTLAHEIGHSIFDVNEEVNVSNISWNANDLKEIRANTFASNFLIPRSALSSLKGNLESAQIIALAKKIQVNIESLLISLIDAGVLTTEQNKEFKHLRIEREFKIDPELKGLSEKYQRVKISLLERGLSDFYVRKCCEAYSMGSISTGKLSEMLLCKEKDLAELLKMFNFSLRYEN